MRGPNNFKEALEAGAFFIGILNNGLNLFQIESYDQLVVRGAVLLLAASLDRWRST